MSMFLISETLPQDRGVAPPQAPPGPAASWYASMKFALEFMIALTLLIATAPVILAAMLLIKLTSPGPAIYTQTRIGRGGRPFTIYKLRTMMEDCESLTGPQWAQPGDGRVTPVGRWLRKLHIDELPQLWNVLIGDMSLIGPRPERPEFLPQLEKAIPLYRQRLDVRPGITGFAQIQLPPDSDIDSVRIKLAYDLHYVHHLGFWLDATIYFGTVLKLIGLTFDVIRPLCWFPKRETVDDEYQKLIQGA
ncbi:MAG: sugar transferase [Planctomycetes bacterium]|nr:sugar transferase [Planctomycetota bacterium]